MPYSGACAHMLEWQFYAAAAISLLLSAVALLVLWFM